MQAKTISVQHVWSSDDGKMTINEVMLEINGVQVKAKTYSKAIATVGWSGEIEKYMKPGKGGRPDEAFVKQPQKEGFRGGGSPRDNDIIRAQWAIGQSVSIELIKNPAKFDIANVEAYANELFDMAERVKAPTAEVQTTEELPVTQVENNPQVEEGNPWDGLNQDELPL